MWDLTAWSWQEGGCGILQSDPGRRGGCGILQPGPGRRGV